MRETEIRLRIACQNPDSNPLKFRHFCYSWLSSHSMRATPKSSMTTDSLWSGLDDPPCTLFCSPVLHTYLSCITTVRYNATRLNIQNYLFNITIWHLEGFMPTIMSESCKLVRRTISLSHNEFMSASQLPQPTYFTPLSLCVPPSWVWWLPCCVGSPKFETGSFGDAMMIELWLLLPCKVAAR